MTLVLDSHEGVKRDGRAMIPSLAEGIREAKVMTASSLSEEAHTKKAS